MYREAERKNYKLFWNGSSSEQLPDSYKTLRLVPEFLFTVRIAMRCMAIALHFYLFMSIYLHIYLFLNFLF
jgi:hypothetical protein